MREIDRYIRRMFRNLPASKEARRCQAELMADANEQYDRYIISGMAPETALQNTLSTVGTVEDLRAALPNRQRGLHVAAWICLLVLLAAIGYIIYYKVHGYYLYIHYFELAPMFIYRFVALPLLFPSSMFLLLFLFGKLGVFRNRFVISNRIIRLIILVATLVLFLGYLICIFNFFLAFFMPGFSGPISDAIMFLFQHTYLFAFFGVALYLGLHHR